MGRSSTSRRWFRTNCWPWQSCSFDPERQAILLAGGGKSGKRQKQFYRNLIRKADMRFDAHLARLKAAQGGKK